MRIIRRACRLLSVGIPFGFLLATAALAEERVFDKKFAVTPGGVLTVATDTGAIKVSGTDTNEVTVHAELRGGRNTVEQFELSANTTDTGVAVVGRRSINTWLGFTWLFGGGLDVRYTIQVPRNYHVQVRTSGGDVELRDFNGRAHGRTSGGNVLISAVNGDVQIHTSGGNVRGTHLIGDVRASTSGGDVKFDNIRGPLDARTSGGNVKLVAIDGKLQAKTSGGDVEVELAGSNRGVDLRTAGGDVTVIVPKQFAANLDALTSGGDVTCELPVTTVGTRHKQKSSITGTLNGGGNPLTVRTSGGDIEIRAGS